MIIYNKLCQTMKDKGFSQYRLVEEYNFSRGQLSRLRHNKNVSTNTLNTLCKILKCDISDIAEYCEDTKENKEKQ